MPTREIGRNEFRPALDNFSRSRQGQRAVLEETNATGERREIRDLPLVGISADDRDGENQVIILLGDRPDRHLTHIVAQPAKIRITEAAQGSEETVEIEAEDGSRTTIRLYVNTSAAQSMG